MPDDIKVPLKQYIEVRIDSLEKASILFREQMDRRLESMNEFRLQLRDQAGTFFTKAEHDLYVAMVENREAEIADGLAAAETVLQKTASKVLYN